MNCGKDTYFSDTDDISTITVPSDVIDECVRYLRRDGDLRAFKSFVTEMHSVNYGELISCIRRVSELNDKHDGDALLVPFCLTLNSGVKAIRRRSAISMQLMIDADYDGTASQDRRSGSTVATASLAQEAVRGYARAYLGMATVYYACSSNPDDDGFHMYLTDDEMGETAGAIEIDDDVLGITGNDAIASLGKQQHDLVVGAIEDIWYATYAARYTDEIKHDVANGNIVEATNELFTDADISNIRNTMRAVSMYKTPLLDLSLANACDMVWTLDDVASDGHGMNASLYELTDRYDDEYKEYEKQHEEL